MSRFIRSARKAPRALGLTVGLVSTAIIWNPASAAEQSAENPEVIIVTGSFIRGTAEDAALPVDVITSEELQKKGTPSTLEMLKSLTVTNGIIGESNQFTAGQAQEGTASINLRGLGATRTLVLLNGKRLASGDANTLPSSAIARIEVLKDGAAATYGSDAIGGVVNFITRDRFQGLELAGDYRYIPDSDGDYNTSITWGTVTDRADFLLSANYFHRSQLQARDRDWAVLPYLENPQGGWTGGSNPTQWRTTNNTVAATVTDPGCAFFGGVLTNSNTTCRGQYTLWDNIVEEQNTLQLYGQTNFHFGASTKLHVEAMYGTTYIPHASTSPSYVASRTISPTVLPAGQSTANFYVPRTNPGFQQMIAQGAIRSAAQAVYFPVGQYRPYLEGGNPRFGYTESYNTRTREHARFSAELTGDVWGIQWTTSATWGRSVNERVDLDNLTGRVALALRGLGGPNCNYLTGTPGLNGCMYLNPFSNAIPANPFTGAVNPNYSANLANSAELAAWLTEATRTKLTQDLWEIDGVLNGDLGLSLWGGKIGWAFGAQYRETTSDSRYNDISNLQVNSCADTPINGATGCYPPVTPYMYLGGYNPSRTNRGVNSVFAELNLPVTDSFNAQIAGRYEDYGNKGGTSFNPKLSLRWQIIDALAFRGSVGTTFRAPPQNLLIPDPFTTLAPIFGTAAPVETTGNPNLKAETATTFSVGLILNLGNFRATLDYWSFDLDKTLTTEPRQAVLDRVFPNGTALPNNCAVDPAFVAAHFDFAGGVCSATGITKVKLLNINGAGIKNTGFDVALSYLFDHVGPGALTLGANATYINKYEVESLVLGGVKYTDSYDAVGLLNEGKGTTPALPPWRVESYLDYSFGMQNLRLTSSFIDSYRDDRTTFFIASPVTNNVAVTHGQVIKSTITYDVAYRLILPSETTLSLTVNNLFDKDPSFARTDLNYDPQTGNPLGRTLKVALRKQF